MLKQMQLSKTEREREVCVGPGVTWVWVQDPLFLQTPGCGAQGLCGHFEPAFRAGAGGDGEGEGSDECGLEAQEEGGSGGGTRTPAGRPSGGPRFQLGTSLGSVGPRLLPSMLTSSPGRWRPAVVSPAAAPAPPPGSANSRPEHGIPFCGGRQDPSPAHTRQSADDLDEGEADRREVEEQRCQHVRVQRPLQPEAVSGNLGARVAGPNSLCCL